MVGGTLVVTEEVAGQGQQPSLELLDVGDSDAAPCEPWGKKLLPRSRSSDHRHSGSVETLRYSCWRIPLHLMQKPWPSLLSDHTAELTDERVLAPPSSLGLTILAKLEDSQFIHTYSISGQRAMRNSDSSTCASKNSSATPRPPWSPWPPQPQPLPRSLPPPRPFPKTREALGTARHSSKRRFESSAERTCNTEAGSSPHESLDLLWELPRYGLEFEYKNGTFLSRDYAGFKLVDEQQLASRTGEDDHAVEGSVDYTLPNFQHYLVLERIHQEGHTFQAQQSDRMIIVPDGTVHRYEIHPRFGHLVASSIVSRLQLAALCSATSSLLPEPRSRMTGAQLAMRLVRWSWTNRQLTAKEESHLARFARFGVHVAPGLHLLCLELERSSLTHKHLYENDGGSQPLGVQPGNLQDPKYASLYLQQSELGNYAGWCQNSRMLLHPTEEQAAMGINSSKQAAPHWIRKEEHRQLEVSASKILNGDVMAKVENSLLALVASQTRSRRHQSPTYPLPVRGEQEGATSLEVDMHAELEDSWKAYHSAPEVSLSQSNERVRRHISTSQSLHDVPELLSTRDGNGSIRRSFRMLRSADGTASVGLLDLVEAALHAPDHLLTFNPFLTKQSCQSLHQAILAWLQLCVLEDRLKRLKLFCKAGATQQLVQELQVTRQWSVSDFPEWLVFEVEGGLQIRPQQYAVAKRLIHEPGAIAQLNMGEGKTRVILPMLVLHLAKGKHLLGNRESAIMRQQSCVSNHESAIMSQQTGYDRSLYLRTISRLKQDVLGRKVFLQPFNRDVDVTVSNVKAMTASLLHCQKSGGILIVAREHRLSLQLKAIELHAKGDSQVCSALDALAALPYIDILDESDELLHHRYQLIYAVGARSALPARQQRAEVIQCLLHVVSQQMDSSLSTVLSEINLDVWTSEPNRPPGSFCRLRLVSGKVLEEVAAKWHRQLARALMLDPPNELSWIHGFDSGKK
eukprot:gene24217-9817_t